MLKTLGFSHRLCDKKRIKLYYQQNKNRIKNYGKLYREKNKEKIKKRKKKWRQSPKGRLCCCKYSRKNKFVEYNITFNEYENRLKQQNYCCAICKKHKSSFKISLAVDHCHKTGKIRGLLCNHCNLMLGFSDDNVINLQSAIVYLSPSPN